MPQHQNVPSSSTGRRALAALATAGVALGAGAGAAVAAEAPVVDAVRANPSSLGQMDAEAGLQGALGALPHATGAVTGLKPNPLAGTGVDPLDNGAGTQLADFQPIATQALTGPVAQAQSIGSMPVVGEVAGLLKG
ncbi:hypothetical protein IAG44_14770 [Streptomyces roseirectus]|uniref:ATP-binding protein n=1 Tax=Streptomyces roseirectus TaxID=2768066 RepID=A0A7H0ICQ8_9ACTN|nr:hypothetical protein [Streptomyces roseirectus]QNP70574.1 hypothetical protein IAG44_14770 [Streptomyces roseirectus]